MSISCRFRDRRRFPSKIANSSHPTPCILRPPLKGFSSELGIGAGGQKTRLTGLLGRERSWTISSAVWIQYINVTDGRTDRHRATAKTALTHSFARWKRSFVLMLLLLFLRLYHEANSGRTVKKSTDFPVAITCIRRFECLDCSSVRVRVFSPFYFRSRIGIVSFSYLLWWSTLSCGCCYLRGHTHTLRDD